MSIVLNAARGGTSAAPFRFSPVIAANAAENARLSLSENLRPLQRISVRMRYGRNETIFGEGDAADHSYKVISGTVRLCKYTGDGRRQIADFVGDGDFFGFLDLADHSFTAEAVTDVILLSYPRSQIDRLGETMPAVRKHVLRLLSENIAAMQRHLVLLGRQTAREKVASFLLRMAERAGLGEGERLDMPIGRQDVADHLGLTVETVCRVLGEFRQKRLVMVPNLQQIVLSNVAALRAVCEG